MVPAAIVGKFVSNHQAAHRVRAATCGRWFTGRTGGDRMLRSHHYPQVSGLLWVPYSSLSLRGAFRTSSSIDRKNDSRLWLSAKRRGLASDFPNSYVHRLCLVRIWAETASNLKLSRPNPTTKLFTPTLMSLLWMLIIGLVVGALAKLLMPGRDPGGIFITMLLGVVGAMVAGFLGRTLQWYNDGEPAGFIASIIGAILVLAIYRAARGRRIAG